MRSTSIFLTACTLMVMSMLVAGCGDEVSAPETIAEAPLLPPQNVVASQTMNGTVKITWDASAQTTLRGYNVYRMESGSSSIATLTSTPVTETHYTDGTARYDRTYEYRVTAVGTRGESRFVASVIETHEPVGGEKRRRKN